MRHLMPSGERREIITGEKRATIVNGKREMLPADPYEIARILRERRSKSPATAAKARMAAKARQRGL